MFYTDVLGLNPAIMGALLMVSKFLDVFTDMLIGYIVDRTNTRLGKARPYELAITFLWILVFMMYATPEMGKVATYAWVFIMYFLQNSICVSVLNGIDSVYMVRAIRELQNRAKVLSHTGIYVMVICTAVTIVIPQVIQRIGVDRHSWMMLILCIAVPCGTIGLLRFLLIPEINTARENAEITEKEKVERISLKESIGALKGNRYIWMFAAMLLLYQFGNGMTYSIVPFFCKYNMGNIGIQSWVNAIAVCTIPLLMIAPKLLNRLGSVRFLRAGLIVLVLGPLIRLAGGINVVTLLLGSFLYVAGGIPIGSMMNIYLFECMDYGEWKNRVRVEGMMGTIISFVSKFGSALATGANGFLMGKIGYVGTKIHGIRKELGRVV